MLYIAVNITQCTISCGRIHKNKQKWCGLLAKFASKAEKICDIRRRLVTLPRHVEAFHTWVVRLHLMQIYHCPTIRIEFSWFEISKRAKVIFQFKSASFNWEWRKNKYARHFLLTAAYHNLQAHNRFLKNVFGSAQKQQGSSYLADVKFLLFCKFVNFILTLYFQFILCLSEINGINLKLFSILWKPKQAVFYIYLLSLLYLKIAVACFHEYRFS